MAAYPDTEDLEWNRDNDNFDVLRRADILVSDFSGVIFDFTLVFDKPVIYADTKFDKSPYDCWWLDTPYWTFEILPQIGQQLTEDNFDTLGDMVQQCLTDPKYAQGRDAAAREPGSTRARAPCAPQTISSRRCASSPPPRHMRRKNRDIFQILDSLLFQPLQLLFEVIYVNANRVIGNPGLSIIVLSLVMNFLVLPLYMRADALQEEERDMEARLHRGVTHIKRRSAATRK